MKKWNKMILTDLILILLLFSMNSSFILAFISIAIHEMSHITLAKYKGCEISRFKINFYGTNAVVSNIDEVSSWDKLQIYLIGPISNFIIALLCVGVKKYYNFEFLDSLISVNLGLGLFNLLPAYPLDGARIIEVILSRKMLYKKSNNIICILSIMISVVIITITIMLGIFIKDINITLIASAGVILYFTNEERKASTYIAMGNIYKKRNTLMRNKYIENKGISVYYKQDMINLMRLVDKNKFNYFFVLDDDLKVIFTMYEDELIEALKTYGNVTLEEYCKLCKEGSI